MRLVRLKKRLNSDACVTFLSYIFYSVPPFRTHVRSSGVLFPFGASEGDEFLPENDDGFTLEIPISVVFPFFDHDHTSLFVRQSHALSTPFKKGTQHDFDRLYFFYPGFVLIKLDILGKPVYLPID